MTSRSERRIAAVEALRISDVTLGSIVQAGDAARHDATALALAVQRQIGSFQGDEGEQLLATHPTFIEPIPIPLPDRSVTMHVRNRSPYIKVGRVDVTSVSSSSLLHIGSVGRMKLESRVLNIRHLIPGAMPQVKIQTE